MTVVRHIAINVFKESVRDKVLYNLVVFAVLLISMSYLIGQLTAGQDMKIIKDLGLAAISLFGGAIAVFIGIGLVWKEVERRSIYALLSKPMRRSDLILGKYCGLALTILINVGVMTVAFYGLLAYLNWVVAPEVRAAWPAPAVDWNLLKAIGLILVELWLVTAIALLFSTFSNPFLSAVLTVGVWVIGRLSDDLRTAGASAGSPVAAVVTRTLFYLLPNFAAFDVKAQVVHGQPVPMAYVAMTVAYGLTYLALSLVVAVTIFSRRDFK